LFNFYHRLKIKESLDQNWSKELKMTSFTSTVFFQNLSKFHDEFLNWMQELQSNRRSFAPFDLQPTDANLFEFIKGINPASKFFDIGKKNYNGYDFELAKADKDSSKNSSDQQKYMDLFYTATEKLVANKYSF